MSDHPTVLGWAVYTNLAALWFWVARLYWVRRSFFTSGLIASCGLGSVVVAWLLR